MRYSKFGLIFCICYFLSACYGGGVYVLPVGDADGEGSDTESPLVAEEVDPDQVEPTQSDSVDPDLPAEPTQGDDGDAEPLAESDQSNNAGSGAEAETPQASVDVPEPQAQAPQNDNADPEPVAETPQNDNADPEPVAEAPQNDSADPEPAAEAPQNDTTDPEPVAEAPQNDTTDPEPVAETPQNNDPDPPAETEEPQSEVDEPAPEVEAPPVEEDVPNPEIESLNAIIEHELRYQNILGGAVAVVRNGRIIHAKGYGFTSLQRDVPVTTDTVFRWASISKTLTAVAALQLDESASNFSINDTVAKHIDYWPSDASAKNDITVRQLLSHRAGVIHYRNTGNCPNNPSPDYDRTAHGDVPFNARQAVGVFAEQPLCFNPGNRFRYSTFGFSLVAAAMEREAGRSYTDWVYQRIASPLGMGSLTQGTGVSAGYTGQGHCGPLTRVTEASKSYVLPGGGWASNITDLAKFANAILQGTLLDDTDRLWQESTGNSNTYRLGIDLSLDSQRAWHTGGHGDLRTYMDLYHNHSENVGIVVYLNNPFVDPERMARRVADGLGISSWSVPLDAGCQ